MMLTSIPAGILVTWASVGALRMGHTGVRFFLLAWGTLWFGSLIATLRAFGWLPTTTLTAYSLQISSAVEMLLLSLALADMINIERKQREAAQQETLKAQHELLEHARTAEEKLERAVIDRTTQLTQALDNEMQLLKQYMRFGALISHEFRNPLGIIDSQISLMRKEDAMGQMPLEKRLKTISSATRRLLSLFEKWLQGDRLNHALQKMNIAPLTLTPWLSEMVHAQSQYHATHQLQLLFSDSAVKVMADEDLLEIAVLNLIDNACKHSDPGTLVQIHLRESPQKVGIAVTDQGPGIAPEHQALILEDYYRVRPEGPTQGLGLGLSFVLRIAQMHHGELEVQSQPGQGSSFCLWLPIAENQ
jgi:signal transduction histidine kinase